MINRVFPGAQNKGAGIFMKLVIVGAGHAGVEIAKIAREKGAQVVLFSSEPCLPYYRPRIIALACGQAEESQLWMHPKDWYTGIDLRLGSPIERIDFAGRQVFTAAGLAESFDRLIIASGAHAFWPPTISRGLPGILTLWTKSDADHLRAQLSPGKRLAIIGGGVIGIELALRAADLGVQVTVVEKLPRLMAAQFGAQAASVLAANLKRRGIVVMTGQSITNVQSGSEVCLSLNGGTLTADVAVFAIGFRRNSLLVGEPAGIAVDDMMRTRWPQVWAAGDVVSLSLAHCSASDAMLQGRVAALNALDDGGANKYQPTDGAVTLKYKDFELAALGPAQIPAAEEISLPCESDMAYRALLRQNGRVVGVQVIGPQGRSFLAKYGQEWPST